MKIKFVTIVLLLSFITTSAQATDRFSEVIVNEVDMKKYDIYKGALLWMADTYKSSINNIQMNDWETGVIVGNGASEIVLSTIPLLGSSAGTFNYKLIVEAKNKKYRIIISDVTTTLGYVEGSQEVAVEEIDFEKTKPLLKSRFNELAKSLHDFLLKSMKDNW